MSPYHMTNNCTAKEGWTWTHRIHTAVDTHVSSVMVFIKAILKTWQGGPHSDEDLAASIPSQNASVIRMMVLPQMMKKLNPSVVFLSLNTSQLKLWHWTSVAGFHEHFFGDTAHFLSHVIVVSADWMDAVTLRVCIFSYLTGESLFSSFFPFDRRPFFFLFARSWESRGSNRMWGALVGLRGLMVPGRRGRTIGDGARSGATSLSTLSVVSAETWRGKWLGGGGWDYKRRNTFTCLSVYLSVCLTECLCFSLRVKCHHTESPSELWCVHWTHRRFK